MSIACFQTPIRNQVQLITYPDSLGGDLELLNNLLVKYFIDIFPGGIHILPPFPSTGDRGFAPVTYFEIEPCFGDWEDVRHIGVNFPVLVDLMVNHISRGSLFFKDFALKGRKSPYADLFITLDKIWPGGQPRPEDVRKIFLRRPEHPFADIHIQETGEVERVWATFGSRAWSEQIDLDVHSPVTRQLFRQFLSHFSQNGVKMVRLDAVAYVIKQPGTSCFFVEPDIYEFLDWIHAQAQEVGIELLLEVHAHHSYQEKLAGHGYWVYNFNLPLLVLHTLLNCSSRALRGHLQNCPRHQFTTLDTHDGIPVQPDIDDLLDVDDAQAVVRACLERGGNLSRILSDAHKRRPDYDAHQINLTYFSALAGNEEAYLAARAIQFFAPGIPQVYYVGLLAGENDPEAVIQTGERRAINRHNYSIEEVEAALQKPVVQRLLRLARFRNTYPAFNGEFSVLDASDQEVHLAWESGEARCELRVDLALPRAVIEYVDSSGRLLRYDI